MQDILLKIMMLFDFVYDFLLQFDDWSFWLAIWRLKSVSSQADDLSLTAWKFSILVSQFDDSVLLSGSLSIKSKFYIKLRKPADPNLFNYLIFTHNCQYSIVRSAKNAVHNIFT